MTEDLFRLTIAKAGALLRAGEISSVELTRSVLDRIDSVDERTGAYLLVTAEAALEQAAPVHQHVRIEYHRRGSPHVHNLFANGSYHVQTLGETPLGAMAA